MITAAMTSEINACSITRSLAPRVRGKESAGLNAVEKQNGRKI
jgi:hypothetical protein